MPAISVIVPVYKVEDYLRECIDSILCQTYTDFELILVDDGSPDNCGIICDDYAAKDSRIIVIHQKNGGLSTARNTGLDIATGKYIYFADSDDHIKQDLLETVIPYMEQGKDLVVFNHDRVFPDGKVQQFSHHLGTYILSDKNRTDFFINTLLAYNIGWEAWNRMFRKEIIDTYHLRFADNKQIFAEDLYFNLCYCAHIHEIISIPQSLYLYNVRDNSIMRQSQNEIKSGRMNELGKELLKHFKAHVDCVDLIDAFPTMHYLIVDNVASKVLHMANNYQEYRKWFREDIKDWGFFKKTMRMLLKKKEYLNSKYSGFQLTERLFLLKYILDGNFTVFRIRYKLALLSQRIADACHK